MQIKPPGAFSRGRIILGTVAPHITPDSLLQELTQSWAPQGFQVYKSALIGLDVALKKSGWTGVAIKIQQTPGGTELAYNAFSPSALVRMMMLGLIPLLILNAKSWKPLLRAFEQYVQGSPFFGGQMQLGAGVPMQGGQPAPAQAAWQPAQQQPVGAPHPQWQPAPQQLMPGAQPQPQPQWQQQPMQAAQPQWQAQQAQPAMPAAQPNYPCPRCTSTLMWVQEYQRWYCGSCQQYV
jgi:hypothetical protein